MEHVQCSYYVPDRGKSTSNQELRDLTEELYALDTFEWNKYVGFNFQHKTYYKNVSEYIYHDFPQKAENP